MPPSNATLTINDRPPAVIPTGTPLLAALNTLGVFVPSACGGHGVCGLCRVTIQDDAGPFSPRELALLSEAARAAGVRLACQVPVTRDLRLVLPPSCFEVRDYTAEVIGLRALTPDIREVRLRLREPAEIAFRAGQFVQLRIPAVAPGQRPDYRCYSIASPPSDHGQVELEVKRVLHGAGSAYVFERLKVGAAVRFHGPHGDFTLRPAARDLLFVAGGSGMAPIKSMLLDLLERPVPRRVRYVFGARTVADLFLMDTLATIEARLPDFRFLPTVLRPEPGDGWQGAVGLVTDTLARLLSPDAGKHTDAYLCGSPAMISACIQLLHARCFSDAHIFYDKFA